MSEEYTQPGPIRKPTKADIVDHVRKTDPELVERLITGRLGSIKVPHFDEKMRIEQTILTKEDFQ